METLPEGITLERLDMPSSDDPGSYMVRINGTVAGDIVSLAPDGIGWIGYVQFDIDNDDTTDTYQTKVEAAAAVVRSYQEYWADYHNAKSMGE